MSLAYLLRRIGTLLLVLFGVSLVTFAIIPLLPGSPARVTLGVQATPQAVATLERQMGLDRPLPVQYVSWIGGILTRGDFGESLISRQPIRGEVMRRLPATLTLALVALAIGLAIAIPAGFVSALKPGSARDLGVSVMSQLGVSVPDFWMGILLILLFSETLGWLPSSGYRPLSDGVVPWARHVLLPAATVGIISGSIMARFVRSALLEVLSQDYVRTAHAKGVSTFRVVLKHALRNALASPITVAGLEFGRLLSGVIVIEIIFAWPGTGRLLIDSIQFRDFPIIQGLILTYAVIFALVNVAVDLSYALLDPRVTLE